MKRSELNEIIKYTIDQVTEAKYPLPNFAFYDQEKWLSLDETEREIVDNMLGWDISDFGSGDFNKIGLTIFTFRNGSFYDKETYPKPYAEKLLFMKDGQTMPFHYHWNKMEDVINRGGGDLEIILYNSTEQDFNNRQAALDGKEGDFEDTPVKITMDGKKVTVPAGGSIVLKPGSSITIRPGQYHSWQAIPGTGDVILFEVSNVNDDTVDNRFMTPGGRFPEIEEDVEAEFYIFKDYEKIDEFK
ncbi:MAG TPA: D-lyxose/D-mannose family sugar isomerase [Dysgonamonadaceae bacterium]|nr:D-lyxose/D-mannose family sugar isomerase [Dysgonamonadaceae bacterium]